MFIQYINITIVRRKERESKIDYKMWDAQCRNRMNLVSATAIPKEDWGCIELLGDWV